MEEVELTEQERMDRASKEVAQVLKKYGCTISTQSVPIITPAKVESDLKQ